MHGPPTGKRCTNQPTDGPGSGDLQQRILEELSAVRGTLSGVDSRLLALENQQSASSSTSSVAAPSVADYLDVADPATLKGDSKLMSKVRDRMGELNLLHESDNDVPAGTASSGAGRSDI